MKISLRKITIAFLATAAFTANALAGPVSVPSSTAVHVKLNVAVNSKAPVGTLLSCEVDQDVMQGGVVVIRAGERARCQIEKANARGLFGKAGQLALSISGTKAVDNQPISLTGKAESKGQSRKGAAWGIGMLLFWPALLIPGGNAELPMGTIIETYTAVPVVVTVQ